MFIYIFLIGFYPVFIIQAHSYEYVKFLLL